MSKRIFARARYAVAALVLATACEARTVWVPSFYGQVVRHYQVDDFIVGEPDLLISNDGELKTPGCNPNSVAVNGKKLYVVCASGFGNDDKILVFDKAEVAADGNATPKTTINSPLFEELIAIAFDATGALWVSSLSTPTGGGHKGALLRIPASELTKPSPSVDLMITQTPDQPTGIAFNPVDQSLWVVGLYKEGILLNLAWSDLNVPGSSDPGSHPKNDITPTLCFSNPPADAGCHLMSNPFIFPEGVAVRSGDEILVSNNGGNAPAASLAVISQRRLTFGGLLRSWFDSRVNLLAPSACPGGLFFDGERLWVNDEGYGVANSTCGAGADQGDNMGIVQAFPPKTAFSRSIWTFPDKPLNPPQPVSFWRKVEFKNGFIGYSKDWTKIPKNHTVPLPTKIPTSSPGFGGIFVE